MNLLRQRDAALLRPSRSTATPVLAIAFAAAAATFASQSPYGAGPARTVGTIAAAVLVGHLVVALVADRTGIGETATGLPYGSTVARPPAAAVALVALSLCLAVAWLAVRPELPLTARSFLALATFVLYLPLWAVYVVAFVVSLVVTGSVAYPSPAVSTAVFALGGALSAGWQLLLASSLVRRAARRTSAESDPDPERMRK